MVVVLLLFSEWITGALLWDQSHICDVVVIQLYFIRYYCTLQRIIERLMSGRRKDQVGQMWRGMFGCSIEERRNSVARSFNTCSTSDATPLLSHYDYYEQTEYLYYLDNLHLSIIRRSYANRTNPHVEKIWEKSKRVLHLFTNGPGSNSSRNKDNQSPRGINPQIRILKYRTNKFMI